MATKTRILKTSSPMPFSDEYKAQYLHTGWFGSEWRDLGRSTASRHWCEVVIDNFLETQRVGLQRVKSSIIEYPRPAPPGDE